MLGDLVAVDDGADLEGDLGLAAQWISGVAGSSRMRSGSFAAARRTFDVCAFHQCLMLARPPEFAAVHESPHGTKLTWLRR